MRSSRVLLYGILCVLLSATQAHAEMVDSECVLVADGGDGASECCWQDACISAISQKLGYGDPMDIVYANVLYNGVFETCLDPGSMATPTALAPCGGGSDCLGTATYMGTIQGCSGYHTSTSNFGNTCDVANLETYSSYASCLDMYFIQDSGSNDVTNAPTWDLGNTAVKVAVFPSVDNAPVLDHSLEFTVYMSNNASAVQAGLDGESQWVEAKLDRLYMEGWSTSHVSDGFVSLWKLPADQPPLRYVRVVSGGSAALYEPPEGQQPKMEVDAVVGVTAQGKPLCGADYDTDGDGVCDVDDLCADIANPSQDDTDYDGIGDACDPCPNDQDNDQDEDGICGDVDNCKYVWNEDQLNSDSDERGDACDVCPLVNDPPQWDNDNDTVGDLCDNCQDDANPDQLDGDGETWSWEDIGSASSPIYTEILSGTLSPAGGAGLLLAVAVDTSLKAVRVDPDSETFIPDDVTLGWDTPYGAAMAHHPTLGMLVFGGADALGIPWGVSGAYESACP